MDLGAAVPPPCRPVEPVPDALVDIMPRGSHPPAGAYTRPRFSSMLHTFYGIPFVAAMSQ